MREYLKPISIVSREHMHFTPSAGGVSKFFLVMTKIVTLGYKGTGRVVLVFSILCILSQSDARTNI